MLILAPRSGFSPLAQETLLQCHCVTLRLMTAIKEAWGKRKTRYGCDLSSTALSQHRKAGTMRSARLRKKPYFNATVSHLTLLTATKVAWDRPGLTGVTECCHSPQSAHESWHHEISPLAQETLL